MDFRAQSVTGERSVSLSARLQHFPMEKFGHSFELLSLFLMLIGPEASIASSCFHVLTQLCFSVLAETRMHTQHGGAKEIQGIARSKCSMTRRPVPKWTLDWKQIHHSCSLSGQGMVSRGARSVITNSVPVSSIALVPTDAIVFKRDVIPIPAGTRTARLRLLFSARIS
jgi:hypothetical protein